MSEVPQRADAVIIGSGFGGAVAALRLAEKGYDTVVLERGPHRQGEDFPRLGMGLQKWLWTSRWNGFFDLRMFPRIATLGSSGLGGGSHIYANVHLRAPERSFREGWPAGYSPETLAPYYERVERMLNVGPLPESVRLAKTEAYRGIADGLGASVRPVNLALHYGAEPVAEPEAEPEYVRDPYGLGVDVMQAPCRYCGECDIGCRYRAKNTLDLNYLAVADQRFGAVVQPLAEVLAIRPSNGGYRVFYQDRERFERRSIWAKAVVLAAGTMGTLELLLRCRDEHGLLPELSPALGAHFSGNGDFLATALNTQDRLDPWHGPVITTAFEFVEDDYHFYLQEGGFAPDLAFIVAALRPNTEYVGKFLRGPVGHAARLRWFYQEVARLASNNDALRANLPGNQMIFLGMGQDASDGVVRLKRRAFGRPKLTTEWRNERSQPLFARMEHEFGRIARELGGDYVPSPLWSLLGRLITVHPLGGAAISDSPEQGVVNPNGEVWGYPNLFVTDGAAIPRAIGPNPAHTIAAISERVAEGIELI